MTSPSQSTAVPMPDRCRCHHPRARHELPGFDGECVADGCRCRSFRPVDQPGASGSNKNLVSSRNAASGNTKLSFENTKRCTGCGQAPHAAKAG